MTDKMTKSYHHIFGPVPSRRLGNSLGLDLVPHKTCTFDCVYCECGNTTNHTRERREYVDINLVISELSDFLAQNPLPDYITFSGAGEPTLNSRIGDIMHYIKKNFPEVPVAVLTNGSLMSLQKVRDDIREADLIIPSLDAATEVSYKKINSPVAGISIEDYIQGLVDLRREFHNDIWLEVFLLPGYNDDDANLLALKEAILRIQPEKVQLNSLDRPGTIKGLHAMSHDRLCRIVQQWDLDMVEIIAAVESRKGILAFSGDLNELILNTIARRPCTLDDLVRITGLHRNEINKYLSTLQQEEKIALECIERGDFYCKVQSPPSSLN